MATYDFTGSAAGASPGLHQYGKFVVYKKHVKAADIIAANTTLAADGKITSGDVLQIIDVPAGFVCMGTALKTVTAEGSATTGDIGVGGGDQGQDGVDMNATAGTIAITLVGDDWGRDNLMGYDFEAADTIDLTAKADIEAGEWYVYAWGIILD